MSKIKIFAFSAVLGVSFLLIPQNSYAQGAGKPNSGSKSGTAVAFAKVNLSVPELTAFGGKGTQSASILLPESLSGEYATVVFQGRYPKETTADLIIATATAIKGSAAPTTFSNLEVVSASPTEIKLRVYGWVAATASPSGNTVFVTAFVAQSL